MAEPSLRDEINEVVIAHLQKFLRTGEMVNVPDWVSEIAASMADTIRQQEPAQQAKLLEHGHARLDRFTRGQVS